MLLDCMCFVCERFSKIWDAAHRLLIEEKHKWDPYSISICFECLGFEVGEGLCANPGLSYSILTLWRRFTK